MLGQLLASVVFKVAGSLFVAICSVLGFGPQEWAGYLIRGWSMLTPAIAQWGFLALGGLTLGGLLWPFAERWLDSRWHAGRTRFQIWEAACFIKNVPPTRYKESDSAQSLAKEIMYYAQQGLINLAGETDTIRNRRLILGRPSLTIDEYTFLSADTARKIKRDGVGWLEIVDDFNRERRS